MPRGGKREGAGRKPSPYPKPIRTTIAIDPDNYNWLKDKESQLGISRSRLINHLIEEQANENTTSNHQE